MTVPERPPDADLLARLGGRPGGSSRVSHTLFLPKRRYVVHALLYSAAAAALLLAGAALLQPKSRPVESARASASASPEKPGDGSVPTPLKGAEEEILQRGPPRRLEVLGRRTLAQEVADAQVIVVATALASGPAPAKRSGDLAENLVGFRVKLVLKGELADKVITTRTPTAAGEFMGKDWIILLSPDFLAGKHQYASHVSISLEPTVRAALAGNKW